MVLTTKPLSLPIDRATGAVIPVIDFCLTVGVSKVSVMSTLRKAGGSVRARGRRDGVGHEPEESTKKLALLKHRL